MADQSELLARQVERLYRNRPEYRSVLDFYIFFTKNAEVELKSVVLPDYRTDQLDSRLASGQPLFKGEAAPLDLEAARRFIERLSQANFPVMDHLLGLIKVFQDRPDELGPACRRFVSGDRQGLAAWARELGVDGDLMCLVIKWALAPSWSRLREVEAERLKDADWRDMVCPLCGAGPYLARLEKDGSRTLACGLCGQEWRFPRLQCPFCGTDDRSVLSYLSAEDGTGYRIDVCGLCRHYIKTVDSREFEEVLPLELVDLLTQHLDLVARERGYTYF